MLVPSQGRKPSQGGGMVGGGVVSSLGTPTESASTVINNINNVTNVVAGDYSKIARITITDLLALGPSEVGENDLWIVYASGSDEDGWSGDPFEYDGDTYPAESFFQLINGEWTPITDEIDLTKPLKFENTPDTVYMIESLFPQTSYPNIYGREKAGMRLARIGKYQVDEEGNYKPVFETTGTPGGGTSSNYLFSIVVPYARSYMDNGEMHYRGGVLDDADYQLLKELIVSGGEKVFFATYGVTSFEDVKDAHDEGKIVFVREGTTIAVLNYFYVNTAYFSCLINDGTYGWNLVHYYILTFADGWSSTTDYVQSTRALIKSVDLSDRYITDNHYLTALAVKTLIDNAGVNVNIDTSVPQDPANDHVPATALMVTLLAGKQNTLTFDTAPTADSSNPVTSGGVYNALAGKSNTNHTHSEYASATTVQEIVLAMNNYATKSLNNLATGAGDNIATAMTKTNVATVLDKLDVESTFLPENTTYFVMSNSVGSAYREKSTSVLAGIKSEVMAEMEPVYVQKSVNNSILLEDISSITSVSSSSIGWSRANVRTNTKYNMSAVGWFVAIGAGSIKISNATTQYGTVWDGNADNRINMGSGRAYICLGHRDLSYSQSSANFKKLIKYISSSRWLFFNEKTGREQDILDFICPIAYVWENDVENYVNCLMFVSKPITDVGIDSTVANTNSFFHLIVEGLPFANWE